MKNKVNRLLALVLVICTILGLGGIPAQAASIADGTQTCTVALGMRNNYLVTTAGTTLRAGDYTYTTNDGLSGPAYCIDHGLDYTDEVLPVVGKYTASPATAGAFANGYPQHSVDTFLGLYLKDNAVLAGLTEAEYAYATQTAVWATLGQLGVDGTPYTAGREYLNPPTGDTQQTRVFRATQLILNAANTWDRVYQTGMYIRLDENAPGGNIAIDSTMTLEFAANENQYGIKREVINGKSYYTREYIFASATSTYYSEYSIELWADNAPEGTIFTDLNNVELARSNFREKATWRLPTEPHYNVGSQINNNGYEYWGKAKLCIPVDTATPSGEITINCAAYVMQYEIYLANNEDYTEQSYILADPSKGTQTADAVLSWGSDITEVGSLMVKKVGGGGEPLAGAEFILTGSSGTNLTGTTDADGEIFWNNLNPKEVFTLMESKAPSGYGVVEPRNVQIIAAHTTFETVKDDPLRTLTVHKQDVQTNYSLRGATFCFEQINGDFKITKVTDHAGNIQLNADQLPLGSYKVYEEAAPEGYNLDSKPQTVNWDGKRDVTMTFTDSRKLTLILSKQDAYTHYNLPGASFEVYRDGQLVTTVTTNEAGLAYVHDVKVGYFEIIDKLPADHKARWFAGAALNSADQAMASILSTVLSRLNTFLDSEMEQLLCFDTAIDAEKFCNQKSAIFIVLPEEDNTKYAIVSLLLQNLYREILAVADENGGKLKNRVVFYCDELGTIPPIDSLELMFSASRSRRLMLVPIVQSITGQLEKNYGKEGSEIIQDNCQISISGGYSPTSHTAEEMSKALGTRTVMSGSVSVGKDKSQTLQMTERPLMSADELKSMPKGQFIVMKTGMHPMQVTLRLFLDWGITFGKPYEVPEQAQRPVAYASRKELEMAIYKSTHPEELESAPAPSIVVQPAPQDDPSQWARSKENQILAVAED